MSNSAFNKDTTGEEVATFLKSEIQGKNSMPLLFFFLAAWYDLTMNIPVLLVGATVKSLGGEFLRVVAPYAKSIWVAGRSKER